MSEKAVVVGVVFVMSLLAVQVYPQPYTVGIWPGLVVVYKYSVHRRDTSTRTLPRSS